MAKETATLEKPLTKEQLHAQDLQARAERRNAKAFRQKQKDCLDAEKAAVYESQKPRNRYRITFDHGKKGTFSSTEIAVNEADAWAKFCDRHKDINYPGPKDPGRKIEDLGPVVQES